jgi:hypothetical protein
MRRPEEAVQGAGMVGPFQTQGAAESDASDVAYPRSRLGAWFATTMASHFAALDRLWVRSHVPRIRRDRAQAEEAGNEEAKLSIGLFLQESAYGPSSKGVRPMNRLRRTSEGNATWLGCWTGGGYVPSVYAPEPPLWACPRAGR